MKFRNLLVSLFVIGMLFGLTATVNADTAVASDSGWKLASPNVGGDLCYDLRESSLGYGPSYTLGTFGKDGIFEVKGMWISFTTKDIPSKLGAGLAVSLPKVLKAWGAQGIPDWFNTSVGVLGLVSLNETDNLEASVGIYCTLIKLEF